MPIALQGGLLQGSYWQVAAVLWEMVQHGNADLDALSLGTGLKAPRHELGGCVEAIQQDAGSEEQCKDCKPPPACCVTVCVSAASAVASLHSTFYRTRPGGRCSISHVMTGIWYVLPVLITMLRCERF